MVSNPGLGTPSSAHHRPTNSSNSKDDDNDESNGNKAVHVQAEVNVGHRTQYMVEVLVQARKDKDKVDLILLEGLLRRASVCILFGTQAS